MLLAKMIHRICSLPVPGVSAGRHPGQPIAEHRMHIDWVHFTPLASPGSGILIGLGTALLLVANGRIAGISRIVGGLLRPSGGDIGWRLAPDPDRPSAYPADGIRPAGRHRHPLRFGLHQRSRRVRRGAPVAALDRRHRKLFGGRLLHCFRDASRH
jgi:hypothetical protein